MAPMSSSTVCRFGTLQFLRCMSSCSTSCSVLFCLAHSSCDNDVQLEAHIFLSSSDSIRSVSSNACSDNIRTVSSIASGPSACGSAGSVGTSRSLNAGDGLDVLVGSISDLASEKLLGVRWLADDCGPIDRGGACVTGVSSNADRTLSCGGVEVPAIAGSGVCTPACLNEHSGSADARQLGHVPLYLCQVMSL